MLLASRARWCANGCWRVPSTAGWSPTLERRNTSEPIAINRISKQWKVNANKPNEKIPTCESKCAKANESEIQRRLALFSKQRWQAVWILHLRLYLKKIIIIIIIMLRVSFIEFVKSVEIWIFKTIYSFAIARWFWKLNKSKLTRQTSIYLAQPFQTNFY